MDRVVKNEGMPISRAPGQKGDLRIKMDVQFPSRQVLHSQNPALINPALAKFCICEPCTHKPCTSNLHLDPASPDLQELGMLKHSPGRSHLSPWKLRVMLNLAVIACKKTPGPGKRTGTAGYVMA